MRRIILLALCALGAKSVAAQQQQSWPAHDGLLQMEVPQRNTVLGTEGTYKKYTRETTYARNVDATWGKSGRSTVYEYDAKGRTISMIELDSATKVPESRFLFAEDIKGKETVEQVFVNQAWQNKFRTQERIISSNTKLRTNEVWQNNAWVLQGKVEKTYDEFDNIINYKNEIIENGQSKEEVYKYEYVYIPNKGKLCSEKITYKMKPDGSYNREEKYEYAYNADGKGTYVALHNWVDGSWVPVYRTNVEYTSGIRDDNSADYISIKELYANGAWLNYERINNVYVYSENFKHTWINEKWINGKWETFYGLEQVYYYNADGTFRCALSSQIFQGNTFQLTYKTTYTGYQEFVTSTKAASIAYTSFDVYPNPGASTVNVSLQGLQNNIPVTITVLNALGQTVNQLERVPQKGAVKTSVSIDTLPAGIYMLRVSNGQGSATQRLVKR